MDCQTYRRWTYTAVQVEILYEHKPSEAWFPNYSLLTIKDNVHFESPCSHCRRQVSGTLIPSIQAYWAVDREFLRQFQSCWKMLICRLVFVYGSCMLVLHHISPCTPEILEQRVSETVDRTRWTDSMACSFPWFECFRFLSLGTSKVYCLWHRRQCPTDTKKNLI